MKKYIAADWKDMEGLVEQMLAIFKELGLNVIEDPIFEGSDMIGFIISDKPINEIEEGNRFDD